MSDMMTFPDTVEEFMESYKIVDSKQIYTNGIAMVPIFRMKQWFEHLPSAQPERKKGKWIEISSTNHVYKCSECGRLLVNVTDGKNNVSKHYPYCHCGADMRGD